ncbi:MAG: PASTA domain-containing protein [Acidimicrobiales bacterium]|jgi:serine/threonine-protein kinase|nr:PASTA domain-containing protein [Acidimicrobiales bacterium]
MVTSDFGDAVGRVLGGRYRIVAPIGVGASAQVFLADDVTLRRRVAVKVLHEALAADDSFLRRFRAEAQSAASLNHQHVLGVYDWGHDGVPYLVSEYLGGGSLESMIRGGNRLSMSQGLLVGLEAARGLEYAHGEGLVHRDIKPANLLFGDAGRLRIADFGLARALAEAGWTEPDGSMVGTARYAAPEQARGEKVGPAADIYALALTVNEAVSGELPFTADTAIATLMARTEKPLEPHPDLGPLGATLRRAGAIDPDERPTAADLVRGFLEAAEDLPRPEPLPLVGPEIDLAEGDQTQLVADPIVASTPRPVPALPAEDDPVDRRWPWAVLAVLVAAAAVIGALLAFRDTQTPASVVPELIGANSEAASAAALDGGWVLRLEEDRQDGSAVGEVLSVDPPPGTELDEGEILTVVVSKGSELVTVPELIGETEIAAGALLESVGLSLGSVDSIESETVEPGLVVELLLDPGQTEVEPGSEVDLVVSAGPSQRQVPAVPDSFDVDDALQALADRRLVGEVVEDSSEDVPVGSVIEFSPGVGAFVDADSVVEIIVSSGPAPRPVPNVVGLTVAEATADLEAAGFEVSGVVGNPALPVRLTDPDQGEVHPFGTKVRLLTEIPDS